MNKMKIVLAGTPSFSVLTFEKIIQNFNVVAIISQPNKPIGRHKILSFTSTSLLANKYKIKLFQPEKIIDIEKQLKDLDFDVMITMAYGQIIPEQILKIAKIGSFNIHASLLPKYRGAAPIQFSLLNGDKETGITFMEMDKKMDAGDIIFQSSIPINDDDNADSLMQKLSLLAQEKIVGWLEKIELNNFQRSKQNENDVTFAPKIQPHQEKLMFDTVEKTYNKIRALSYKPGAYILDPNRMNKRVKIFKASKEFIKNAIEIKCTDGILYGFEYQIEGKNKVSLIYGKK